MSDFPVLWLPTDGYKRLEKPSSQMGQRWKAAEVSGEYRYMGMEPRDFGRSAAFPCI